MFCGFLIRDLNLEEEETEESLKYKEKRRLKKEKKLSRKLKDKSLSKENSDLSNKINENDYKIDLNLKSEAVHLLNNNNLDTKNENIQTKNQVKPVNQNSVITSSSDDSYSLSSESSSSSSNSSSTSDLRTINDPSFSEKLSDQFDKFDTLLSNKCDDDDVFETNLLTSCNGSTTSLKKLVRSSSTICLPTYLEKMYNSLKNNKELSKDFIGNQSTTTTPKLVNKNKTDSDLR